MPLEPLYRKKPNEHFDQSNISNSTSYTHPLLHTVNISTLMWVRTVPAGHPQVHLSDTSSQQGSHPLQPKRGGFDLLGNTIRCQATAPSTPGHPKLFWGGLVSTITYISMGLPSSQQLVKFYFLSGRKTASTFFPMYCLWH